MVSRFKAINRVLACLAVMAAIGLPSAAVAQQKSYLVFFDFETSDIGQSGKLVVDTVAEAIKSDGKIRKAVLVGHTDTAEPSTLSQARAVEVAKALVATGALPSGFEMILSGVGASRPLVKTEAFVREPQNRFVEVLLDAGPPPATETKGPPPQAAVSPPKADGLDSIIARIPGDYACQGSNPNGSTYRCNVTITRSGNTYSFRWLIADGTRYSGTGYLRGRTLTVDWGQSAPVIYQVGDDGVLRGRWARGAGRETLTPDR
jgi:hypothetical protein